LPLHSTLLTMPSLYAETLAHLVLMAKTPGWKGQAWHRAQELEKCPTYLWLGISTDLINTMKAHNDNISGA
jgi:hypothetical protein